MQPDPTEDAVIDTARLAAVDYGVQRLARANGGAGYPADTTDLPDAIFQAAVIDAAHLYRRRDSIDGTIAWGDMGAIRVGTKHDPDAEAAYALYTPQVFA
jgi:hypothetical protein